MDLFTGLVVLFLFFIYIYIFSLSLFVSVYVYATHFVCIGLLLPFVRWSGCSFLFFHFFSLSSFSSEPCGWKGHGVPARCQA